MSSEWDLRRRDASGESRANRESVGCLAAGVMALVAAGAFFVAANALLQTYWGNETSFLRTVLLVVGTALFTLIVGVHFVLWGEPARVISKTPKLMAYRIFEDILIVGPWHSDDFWKQYTQEMVAGAVDNQETLEEFERRHHARLYREGLASALGYEKFLAQHYVAWAKRNLPLASNDRKRRQRV